MNEKLMNEIRYYNKKSPYKIKYRKRKNDYALYLDLQRKDIRSTINLNLYVTGKISYLNTDLDTLKKAVKDREVKNEEFELGKTSPSLLRKKLQESDVIKYILNIAGEQTVLSTRKNWLSLNKHLNQFSIHKTLKFKHIDRNFCKSFASYLISKLSPNTANVYFGKFKQMLYLAVDDKIYEINPAVSGSRITISKKKTVREFLTLEEIKQVYDTNFHLRQLKNAFVFSCFTGLRFVDTKQIRFEDIVDSTLIFTQSKTGEPVRIKLHSIAQEIVALQKAILNRRTGLIFEIPNYEYSRIKMHQLIEKAGINKHITFHCGRHTFATLCLTYDIDIFTVSKLLGHTDVKNTQIYATLIDKKKDQAIDKLPSF
ncbi:MAG: site-specific integrase [Candidatus Cloacimonetes bacterium]|jgi:integrase|nr:site-specific integrase [Candidatus Cloacimonadota bacterium]MBT4334157.1 site-specific integrase [Candidatus Cloacimonadota bacterium]